MYRLGGLGLNVNDPNWGVMTNPGGSLPGQANPTIPALNCPGDPGCPGYVAPGSSDAAYAALVAAGNPKCTCILGQCMETGDSCSSPAVASPFWIAGLSNQTLLLGGLAVFVLALGLRK